MRPGVSEEQPRAQSQGWSRGSPGVLGGRKQGKDSLSWSRIAEEGIITWKLQRFVTLAQEGNAGRLWHRC
ncbi:hypothetical protein DV515_00013376 [Chloebia gouldiae]|uniref:Uncharacterized protein n=1 Tax=Chloebia gouldiae TaxID=44316 RepID=A0A3L8S1H7_CHLGU|nr:hypothetical protein DV515_00013376 [Chloebia gouldiae]